MPDSSTQTTELTSQYSAQVASDLERNAKEQQRLSAEISAFQEQLLALQHDSTVLASMQKALGFTETAVEPAPAAALVPPQATAPETDAAKPRAKKARTAKSGTATKSSTPAKSSTAAKSGTAAKKPAAKAPAAAAPADKPTLVGLIRTHLEQLSEPRSAAEITSTLAQAHPDRTIKTTVVRTTLEGLVAKSHAHRSKQGSSVFYTATNAAASAAAPQSDTEKADS